MFTWYSGFIIGRGGSMFANFLDHNWTHIYIRPKNKFEDMNCLKSVINQTSYRYTQKLGLHKPVRLWLSPNIDPHAFKWFHRIHVYLIFVTQGWSCFIPLSVMMKRGTKLNQLWVPMMNIPITLSHRFNTNIPCILGMQR